MLTRKTVFLVFVTVQMIGFLLLELFGVMRLEGFSLRVEQTVFAPATWIAAVAGVLWLDLLNAVLLTALFRRAERGE